MRRAVISTFAVLLCLSAAASAQIDMQQKLVYLGADLTDNAKTTTAIGIIQSAAQMGYNGIVWTDWSFTRLDLQGATYLANAARFRQACTDNNMRCIPAVFPFGWSSSLIHWDANLAEGLNVKDAPMQVTGGQLVSMDTTGALANGGLETYGGSGPTGWSTDRFGTTAFQDTSVKHGGNSSLRYTNPNGNGRIIQGMTLAKHRCYHVRVWLKTSSFASTGSIQIKIIGTTTGQTLNYNNPQMSATQDWTQYDLIFNSLEEANVNFYVGSWSGTSGQLWIDDITIEPAGFVNVLRKSAYPPTVTNADPIVTNTTYADGSTHVVTIPAGGYRYAEGKDYAPIVDPGLGENTWHSPFVCTIPAGSKLKEADKVLVSYDHNILVSNGQQAICMSDPKVYDMLTAQAKQVHQRLTPDGYFMGHDEIRMCGYDGPCARLGLTPGQILASNASQCVSILRSEDRGKEIYVWSDDFDPYHNAAQTGKYYLCKGDGPFYNSWQGLPSQVTIMNWHNFSPNRPQAMQHFANLGHKQVLSGFYDGSVTAIDSWLVEAKDIPGVVGAMYTTWNADYSKLQAFMDELNKYKK